MSAMLKSKLSVTEGCMNKLDLDGLAQRTEGFVARDLEKVLSRAVHAHLLRQGRGKVVQ